MANNVYYKTSSVTGKTYDLFSVIRILNVAQSAFYEANGVKFVDLEISADRKSGRPVWVFLYNRDDTKEVYKKWCDAKDEQFVIDGRDV